MPDRDTIDVYNDRAEDYLALPAFPTAEARLVSFLKRLPEGATVLDLGCGPGKDSNTIRTLGHTPDPLDASREMVRLAKDHFGLPARIGDFNDLRGPYDGVWASFSLLHMPLAELPGYLIRLHDALTPQGLLGIAMKTGSGEARDTIGRRYSYCTQRQMTDWLSAAQFTPLETETGRGRGLSGSVDEWFAITAQANPLGTIA